MSNEKKGSGTPAVKVKEGRKTTFKCGKKNTVKTDKKQGVDNA